MGMEKSFENKIKRFLEEQGCWFVKFHANAYTKSGIPDILVCCNGFFLGVEVKAPNGRPSALQIYNLRKIDASGGYGILLYPKDWQLFKDFVLCMKSGDVETVIMKYDLLKERWCNHAGLA